MPIFCKLNKGGDTPVAVNPLLVTKVVRRSDGKCTLYFGNEHTVIVSGEIDEIVDRLSHSLNAKAVE